MNRNNGMFAQIKSLLGFSKKKIVSRVGISSISLNDVEGSVDITGWSMEVGEKSLLVISNEAKKPVLGILERGLPRNDIASKFPEYFNANPGWSYKISLSDASKLKAVIVTLFDGKSTTIAKKVVPADLRNKIIGDLKQKNSQNISRIGISSYSSINDGKEIKITGWFLTKAKESVLFLKDDKGNTLNGSLKTGFTRNDIAKKYPEYFIQDAGWEFVCNASEMRATTLVVALLRTSTGDVTAEREFQLSQYTSLETPTKPKIENTKITIEHARFRPLQRQLIVTGEVDEGIKVADLRVRSSSRRAFVQEHIKLIAPGKSGRPRWQFRAICGGYMDGESILVSLAEGNPVASSRIVAEQDGNSTFANLAKGAARPAVERLQDPRIPAAISILKDHAADLQTHDLPPDATTKAVYFPQFEDSADLTNHYYRAAWYLTGGMSPIASVVMGRVTQDVVVSTRPDHFANYDAPEGTVNLVEDELAYNREVLTARIILIWRPISAAELADLKAVVPGAQLLTVATDDLESTEYGNYCKAQWTALHREERESLLAASRERFSLALTRLREQGKEVAAVFGTGPSIEKAFDYDFSKAAAIVCNTIVADDALLDHLSPAFICAGDVVSHFGVSSYADRFRQDLLRAIRSRDTYFFTTSAFGYLLSTKYPEISEKIIFCEQRFNGANTDLLSAWALPKLDSTLNIHMLPIAATFSDRIFILGCDGKNPDPSKNEDFWAHSAKTHYHDLVSTGHLAHPTFDARRQTSTFSRYLDSTEESCLAGEIVGKVYFSLEPSFTPALKARPVAGHFLSMTDAGRKLLQNGQGAVLDGSTGLKKILIVSRCPPHLFSGGRYLAVMIAEAMALRGHQVTMWMDNKPYWWSYLAMVPNHEKIQLWLNDFDVEPEQAFDQVYVIPDTSVDPKMYLAALECAQFNGAKLTLVNFETPNWFNSMSPEVRDSSKWVNWYVTSLFADQIISCAAEGTFFAREFYDRVQAHCDFDQSAPAINTYAADLVRSRNIEPENQVICISRFGSNARHKNVNAILRVIPEEMRGYTLALVVGTAPLPPAEVVEALQRKLAKKGVTLKLLHGISDVEKFEEIAKSKVMVFQSYFEGYGYPPIEAQYMGRPCVAFDLPVLREFSSGRAVFVDVDDYTAFRREMSNILNGYDVTRYAHFVAEIDDTASVVGSSRRLQAALDRAFSVERRAVDRYEEQLYLSEKASFEKMIAEAAAEALAQPKVVEKPSKLPDSSARESASGSPLEWMEIKSKLREEFARDDSKILPQLLGLIDDSHQPGQVAKQLVANLAKSVWREQPIFERIAGIEDGDRLVTVSAAVHATLAACKWALPREFDTASFMKDALATCKTSDNVIALLRRRLRNREGELTLLGANLALATEADLPVLFDEIIVKRSYFLQTGTPMPYVIDGGSNIGLSLYSVLNQFPEARIVAFEPGRMAGDVLERNITRNNWSNVTLHRAALAGEPGRVTFYEPKHMSMGGSLSSRLEASAYALDSYEVEKVQLSDFIDQPVDLLKLDIEGAEIEVLRQIEGKLDKVIRLFVEIHAINGCSSLEMVNEVVDLLTRNGFNCHCEPAKIKPGFFKFQINSSESYVLWAIRPPKPG